MGPCSRSRAVEAADGAEDAVDVFLRGGVAKITAVLGVENFSRLHPDFIGLDFAGAALDGFQADADQVLFLAFAVGQVAPVIDGRFRRDCLFYRRRGG